MLPYAGRPANPAIVRRDTPTENVEDLTVDIRQTGRNITMDRYLHQLCHRLQCILEHVAHIHITPMAQVLFSAVARGCLVNG